MKFNKLSTQIYLIAALGGMLSPVVLAQSKANVLKLESVIRGNQEQPKVLTIVPWQTPKTKAIFASLQTQLMQTEFEPLERSSFIRQISFHHKLSKQVDQFDPAYPTPEE
ncbi:hypothetical protein QX776_06605 [Alteromonadaceae bacterium BrNp21-10]|nr:hypothetical protein [Alteromonadaceae bacterium BrNp21-10]